MRFLALPVLLIPAIVSAQAPGGEASLGQRLRTERPEVERLISELKSREAQARAEALLPPQVPAFNKADNQALVASYVKYLELSQAYYLAFKAADAAGQWEKALEHIRRAKQVATENHETVKEPFTKLSEYYKNQAQRGKGMLQENAEYIKGIRAKANPDESDKQQLELVAKEEKLVVENEKWSKVFLSYIDAAKQDAERYDPFIETEERRIKDQEERIADYKAGKGDKGRWVEAIMANPKTMEALTEKKDRIAFLYRLAVLDPENKKVHHQIDVLLGNAAPAPEKKPAKGKKGR
ncbi:MAG: hypothetical protein HY823_06975 [Acidobacteria bacterium]|nr:hypothetical protein [Acidobacteriota bacterium]